MKTFNSQAEVDASLNEYGDLIINDHVTFDFPLVTINGDINARDINAWDINAGDINAWDINARDINAWDINAWDINAGDINAGDINAWDINAWDINAWDINAWDINAGNINAGNITYLAVCFAYNTFKCRSIKGTRKNAKHFCLDSAIEIIS